ncbi:hypothetical protein ACQEVZ_00255 [Dactylosporangium sp. CA-152071]|uniref:hypothetical protein n=1 Tax=Dactylosporangium sp. CA-152071 TaxID=3239933 RepID=UPI003D8B967D
MSDFYASVIPTDATWQPTAEAAAEAEAYVRRMFPDPDGVQQDITVEFYDRITAVDAGENLERITCPRCGGDIPVDWYADLLEEAEAEFDDLTVTVPCCHARTALDTLDFDWPCGFARFEIAVANPARVDHEVSPAELADLARILGHPVRQILIHI